MLSKKMWGTTYWTIKGLLSKINAFVSIADIAWCFATDFNTNPLSPGTVFSFSSSTSHLPKIHTHTHTHRVFEKKVGWRNHSLFESKELTANKD